MGDLDGDGVGDLAVGAFGDDDGGSNRGAVWLLLLDGDGSVKCQRKISATSGSFGGALDPDDRFGVSLARLDDVDGNGFDDLAIGAELDDDGTLDAGAVWISLVEAPDLIPPSI